MRPVAAADRVDVPMKSPVHDDRVRVTRCWSKRDSNRWFLFLVGLQISTEAGPRKNNSKSLKSSAKTPEVGVPIDADRDPTGTKSPSIYQGVEAYPRWAPALVLIHT
jgi:hypothetical protein